MKRLIIAFAILLLLPASAWAQANHIYTSSTEPTSCQVQMGDIYVNSTLLTMKICTATNTWKPMQPDTTETRTSSATLSKLVTYCDPTSAGVNLALPPASTYADQTFFVKQINSAAHACTITGTIDGNTNDILGGVGYTTGYHSDGSAWRAHTIGTPALAAPGADVLVGFNNTAGTGIHYFTIGSGLSFNSSTNTLTSSGGTGCSPASTNGKILTDNGSGGCTSNTTGSGVLTALGTAVGSSGSFVTNGGALGTPTSGVGTNITGLPISTGVSGLGTGVATALGVNTGSAGSFLISGFTSVPVSGQTTVTASNATALTFVAGTNMTITTDNSAKSITFTASGGGGSGCSTSGTGNVLTSDGAGGCTSNTAATYSAGKLTLGTANTTLGAIKFFGNTSGDVTLQPNAVAGTAVTLTLPAASATIASTTGSVTTNNCAKWDSSGRLVDSGGTCGSAGVFPALSANSGSTDQTGVTNATFTKVTLGTVVFDTNSNFASSTFTPTVAGKYQVNGGLYSTNAITSSVFEVAVCKNGAPGTGTCFRGITGVVSIGTGGMTVSGLFDMNGSTDTIALYGFATGATTVTFTANEGTFLTAVRVGG